MKTDLASEDEVVRFSAPHMLTEVVVGAGGAGGAECGRRLLSASRAGDAGAVRALLVAGAPFTSDWLGTGALHLAAANGHAAACTALLRAGVSRDARTKVERTPLQLAACAGHADVVRVLLEHGAAPDARDMLGMTALHWACARGHEACARLLLAAGADPTPTSKFLTTPQSLARAHPATAALLAEAIRARAHPPAPSTTSPAAPAEAPGARVLRAHGITLLPADPATTVLNALHSGRTVVLSDAGKLMLKESAECARGGGGGGTGGVVLTATPVSAPAPSGRVFTIDNNKLVPATPTPTPTDTATPTSPSVARPIRVRMKPAGGAGAVRIVMNRASFQKLVTAARAAGVGEDAAGDETGSADSVSVVVPEQFVRSGSPQYLRAQLLCAHAALADLGAELRRARRALADRH